MITVTEIRELKDHYVSAVYNKVREEQKIDQEYRDDVFPVPQIKSPKSILRQGLGARMVDSPAEQLVSRSPKADFLILKGAKDVGIRLSEEVNQTWIGIIRKQNPNPFKEFFKNLLGRGEGFIQLVHNQNWVTGDKIREGLPVHFLIPDPMTVFASPEEDERGIPFNVIMFYKRTVSDIRKIYPDWRNPQHRKDTEQIDWLAYFDSEVRYFEADGEPVLADGIQPNLYKKTPFIRKYSGFGRRSPDGKMEDLIVSDLRLNRGIIQEICAIRSDIASSLHLFAHPRMDLTLPEGAEINQEELEKYDMGAGALNVMHIPVGGNLSKGEVLVPPPEAFQHLYSITNELNMRNPFLTAGFPSGANARQQDLSYMAALKRYDTILENTELAFETAIEDALDICKEIPTLKPDTLHKGDLDAKFICKVELRAEDELQSERQITLGDRLWAQGNGSIDLRTNLTEFQGRTQDESDDIIANILVDKLTLYNPDVAQVMGMVFAEESGMSKWLEQTKMRNAQLQEQQTSLQNAPSPTTQQRVKGEQNTQLGREMIDMALANKGPRQPPSSYTRGQ